MLCDREVVLGQVVAVVVDLYLNLQTLMVEDKEEDTL